MMSRRKLLFGLFLGTLSGAFPSHAQKPARIWHIGFLGLWSRSTASNPQGQYDAFMQGMRDLGYIDGRNCTIEWRFAEGDNERLPSLALELVRLKVDLIVTHGTGVRAAQRATSTIPIVAAAVADPLGSGYAASLARPGGNITGMSLMTVDMSPKHVELLKSMVPTLSRVAVLMNPDNSAHPGVVNAVQAAGQQAGVTIVPVVARTAQEIERGVATMRRERAEACIVVVDAFFFQQREQIAGLAVNNRLATMFTNREHVMVGGLMSYGQNVNLFYRRAATYVDKILKGAKPGELPIEQPTELELVINRKTAQALGLTIPQTILVRADRVIE